MSQNIDPYQPPTISSNPVPTSSEIETMRNIAFWQNFFSILGYIASGLTLIALVANVLFSTAGANAVPRVIGAIFGSLIGLAIVLVVYVIPSVLLGAASRATRDFGEGRIALGDYANQQKKFWRYLGVMVCIVMAIYFVMLVLVVLALVGTTAMR